MSDGRTGKGDFARLGELLGDAGLKPAPGARHAAAAQPRQSGSMHGPDPGDIARRVAEVWDEIVGPEIAANARPLQLNRGRLVVATSSSAWAQSLHFMGDAIRERLSASLSTEEIRSVFFRHAGWEAAPDRPSAPREREPVEVSPEPAPGVAPDRLTEEEEAALEGVRGLDVSPELREVIARAMKAAFVREEQD